MLKSVNNQPNNTVTHIAGYYSPIAMANRFVEEAIKSRNVGMSARTAYSPSRMFYLVPRRLENYLVEITELSADVQSVYGVTVDKYELWAICLGKFLSKGKVRTDWTAEIETDLAEYLETVIQTA